jgi:hypothetical protein
LVKKGNYFECFPPKLSSFTESCRKANIHMDAGLFGRPAGEGAAGMRVPMKQVWVIYVVIYMLLYTDIW